MNKSCQLKGLMLLWLQSEGAVTNTQAVLSVGHDTRTRHCSPARWGPLACLHIEIVFQGVRDYTCQKQGQKQSCKTCLFKCVGTHVCVCMCVCAGHTTSQDTHTAFIPHLGLLPSLSEAKQPIAAWQFNATNFGMYHAWRENTHMCFLHGRQ